VATAETIYADPSALLKLYLNEPQSRAMTTWRAKIKGPVAVTHHGRLELLNAIGLAAYRGAVSPAVSDAALEALDDDFDQGRYTVTDMLWRATMQRAGELSRRYTRQIGCRPLDILHVASALELKCRSFVTFDVRQQELARAVKLKIIVPA
jgi:predicted nucleic acid-binding protein